MNIPCLNECMQTDWLKMLDVYWDEKDISYSDNFDYWPDWLLKYYNELTLVEAIESANMK